VASSGLRARALPHPGLVTGVAVAALGDTYSFSGDIGLLD
jgi:hypothetical protein